MEVIEAVGGFRGEGRMGSGVSGYRRGMGHGVDDVAPPRLRRVRRLVVVVAALGLLGSVAEDHRPAVLVGGEEDRPALAAQGAGLVGKELFVEVAAALKHEAAGLAWHAVEREQGA